MKASCKINFKNNQYEQQTNNNSTKPYLRKGNLLKQNMTTST